MAAEPETEPIGRRLRRLRLAQGLAQRDLSAPGVTYAYISRIEAGTRQPSVKALRMLARKLGVTPGYLETGSKLGGAELRELRLAEQELRLRLRGEPDLGEIHAIGDEADAEADMAALLRVRILLGFVASARGDHLGAIEQLAEVIDTELVTPCSRPDVYATLGHAYASAGDAEKAVALFERAIEDLRRMEPHNRAAELRYATYLSYALTDLGQVERARAILGDVLARAGNTKDIYAQVRLFWSLGRVALEEGHPLAAVDNFRRAIALLEATEDAVHLARAHVACAEAAIAVGTDLEAARAQLDEAERLLQGHTGGFDLAALRRIQALLALRSADPAGAVALAEQAFELSRDTPQEHGRCLLVLAQARAAAGQKGAAESFEAAAAQLGQHGTGREHADALLAYGRYLRDSGREREALAVFEQAAEIAARLHGEPSSANL